MPLVPGTKLGPYEIHSALGAGAWVKSIAPATLALTEASRSKFFPRSFLPIRWFANVDLAPNGKSVAVDQIDMGNQNSDVWIYDLQGESAKRMTFGPAIDAMPVWSPDGTRVAFWSARKSSFDLYLKNTDGAQEERAIETTPGQDKYPSAWSRDGKYILYTRGTDLWFLTFPDLRTQLFLKAPSAMKDGQFSPDAKWVAYASNESGKGRSMSHPFQRHTANASVQRRRRTASLER